MKIELIDGNLYYIDKGYASGGIVKLIRHGKHFCTVEDPDNGTQWETMTYRLSEIDEVEPNT